MKHPNKQPLFFQTKVWILIGALLLSACQLERTVRKYHPEEKYSLMGQGSASKRQLTLFLLKHNPKADTGFVDKLATTYMREAAVEDINYDIAFAQMCLETGFLKFGNQVLYKQYNFAGLGATDDGARGLAFPNLQIGVRAHIQHLKAYASNTSLRQKLVDPRFKYVKRNSAPEIDGLTGKWATDPKYGQKIKQLLYKLSQLQ